jgi:hypothetical protein
MKIFLILDGWGALGGPGSDRPRGKACPTCAVSPFRVAGKGKRPSKDDRAYEADGHCTKCGQHVGLIRAETDTLFGVREDAEVLSGRYGHVIY